MFTFFATASCFCESKRIGEQEIARKRTVNLIQSRHSTMKLIRSRPGSHARPRPQEEGHQGCAIPTNGRRKKRILVFSHTVCTKMSAKVFFTFFSSFLYYFDQNRGCESLWLSLAPNVEKRIFFESCQLQPELERLYRPLGHPRAASPSPG